MKQFLTLTFVISAEVGIQFSKLASSETKNERQEKSRTPRGGAGREVSDETRV